MDSQKKNACGIGLDTSKLLDYIMMDVERDVVLCMLCHPGCNYDDGHFVMCTTVSALVPGCQMQSGGSCIGFHSTQFAHLSSFEIALRKLEIEKLKANFETGI